MEILPYLLILLLIPLAYWLGTKSASRKMEAAQRSKRIEEYPFYPFVNNEQGIVEFSQPLFNEAVQFLLKHKNAFAAAQLIVIGEQNIVRDVLATDDLNNYLSLYQKFGGQELLSEHDRFMENYKRIVTLIGRSFRDTGVEILLHNLVNPTKSVIAIENGEVTGRKLENGTTNLLLDLKTRKLQNKDKLNYELRIGSRLFKCTTIPIFRTDYGLVGAICINVDANFIRYEVLSSKEKLESFISNILKTEFLLEENILSKDEYQAAMAGKRFYTDTVFRKNPATGDKRLLAILFSDVVNYSALMSRDENQALEILRVNREIHMKNVIRHRGALLKEIGDGVLCSFDSVSDAVLCSRDILSEINRNGQYQLRIGIHMGEVNTHNNDIFGDGVNIAARLQSIADPGSAYISEVVHNNIRNKMDVPVAFVGEKKLKNIEEPVRVYRVFS